MSQCRKCSKEGVKLNLKGLCRTCARKFPKPFLREMYFTQIDNSRTRGLPLPNYSFEEFRSWILAQPNFKALYKAWVNSKFDKYLKPSVDRIKEWETYTIDNIQVITWAENKAKGGQDCKEGKRYHRIIPTCSFNLETEELCNQYISAHEAERQTGIKHNTIASAMNISRKHNGNKLGKGNSFKWMYLLDFITNTLQDIEGVPRNLQVEKIHHSQINFDGDTCLVSINRL